MEGVRTAMITRSVESTILKPSMEYHTTECPWYGDNGKDMTVREYLAHMKGTDCKPPDIVGAVLASRESLFTGRGILSGRPIGNPRLPYWHPFRQPQPLPVKVTNLPSVQAVKRIDPKQPEGIKSKLWWIIVGAGISTTITSAATAIISILMA